MIKNFPKGILQRSTFVQLINDILSTKQTFCLWLCVQYVSRQYLKRQWPCSLVRRCFTRPQYPVPRCTDVSSGLNTLFLGTQMFHQVSSPCSWVHMFHQASIPCSLVHMFHQASIHCSWVHMFHQASIPCSLVHRCFTRPHYPVPGFTCFTRPQYPVPGFTCFTRPQYPVPWYTDVSPGLNIVTVF